MRQTWLFRAVTGAVVAGAVLLASELALLNSTHLTRQFTQSGRPLLSGQGQPSGSRPSGSAAPSGRPQASVPGSPAASAGAIVPVGPGRNLLGEYRAPDLAVPLVNRDPGLAKRGPRQTLEQLYHYQVGDPAVMFDPRATPLDWQLANPNPVAVRGYASDISVLPGESLTLHLTGDDRQARLDVFRMGLGDGRHVLTVLGVPVFRRPEALPDPANGLVEEEWPVSATLRIPVDWSSGMYLVKLTGNSGGNAYIPFVVRASAPAPLMVVLPTMTWQAYNLYGGSNLYSWTRGPRPRAYMVSFNRPFTHGSGAGLFFRLDFPLLVWLEDHGYAPAYLTDLDIARSPGLIRGAQTVVFAGHGEYWTGGMRTAVEAAARTGSNLAFFGSNQAFWQVRFLADGAGRRFRTMVCYKDATIDPITPSNPDAATTRFEQPPVNRPPSRLIGLKYGGVIEGIKPMIVGPGILTFAPDLGLVPGQELPGLIGNEIDEVHPSFSGILLGATPIRVVSHDGTVTAGASLWISPAGNRVFDAGTFDFSWGLDPRYAASLPGFPAAAFSELTAHILAWLGTQPTF